MKKLLVLTLMFAASFCSATQYSKLALITAAKEAGVWASLKDFITRMNLKDEWDACQYITDDYAQFAAATNAIVSEGLATPEQITSMLSASVDTAVSDAAIARYYANDMKSKSGRGKWHGKVVRTVVDTDTMTKTTYYEDGTVFVDNGKVTTAISSANVAKEKVALSTNNVPTQLAAARLKVAADKSVTNTVTVTLKAGGN